MSKIEIKELSQEDIRIAINEYIQSDEFSDSFVAEIFDNDILRGVDSQKVKDWLSSPEEYQQELEHLSLYYYITNSAIFQLYDMAEVLPTLKYRIRTIEKDEKYEDNNLLIKRLLKKVKHKQLTRDLITQTAVSGTTCGIWVGNKKNPYLFIFNDLEYVFPAYIKDGDWALWLDLSWFDTMTEFQKEFMFESLKPHVTENDYNKYNDNPEEIRYIELPLDRTICLRTHTLYRNQRLGIPWGTQSFFDNIHKEKLKDLEKSISNKVINSVAVLTLGNDVFTDDKLNKNKKNRTYRGVKTALQKNNAEGITVIGIPHWADLDFPSIKTEGLDPKKFESINEDLNAASNGVMNIINSKSNFSTGKLTLDLMYRKISILLEQIEEQVYQKLINTILRKKEWDNYYMEYDKQAPLSTKEQIAILESLSKSFGFSLKAIVDKIEGVDFDEYISDSIYEQETLKLPERIQPYRSAYTSSGDEVAGAPIVDDVDNPATESTKTGGGNDNPKPSTD